MNIGPVCSSPIDVLLGIINRSCSCSFLVQLAINYFQKLVTSCSQIQIEHPYHYDINFVFLHIISQCPISHSNTIIYIYCFHLCMIHCWIQIQVLKSFSKHSHNSKPSLAMKCNLCSWCLFLITYNPWKGFYPFWIYHFIMSILFYGLWTFMLVGYWGSIIWSMIVYLNNHNRYFLIEFN